MNNSQLLVAIIWRVNNQLLLQYVLEGPLPIQQKASSKCPRTTRKPRITNKLQTPSHKSQKICGGKNTENNISLWLYWFRRQKEQATNQEIKPEMNRGKYAPMQSLPSTVRSHKRHGTVSASSRTTSVSVPSLPSHQHFRIVLKMDTVKEDAPPSGRGMDESKVHQLLLRIFREGALFFPKKYKDKVTPPDTCKSHQD